MQLKSLKNAFYSLILFTIVKEKYPKSSF